MSRTPERLLNRMTRRRWIGAGLAGVGAALIAGPRRLPAQAESGSASDSSSDQIDSDLARKGLEWLAKRQRTDGSFVTEQRPGDPGIVAIIGKAFLAEGSLPGRGKYGELLTKCAGFVVAQMNDKGYIRSTTGGPASTMYSHAFATAFLAEAYHGSMNARMLEAVERAVRLTSSAQNDAGGWRYAPSPAAGGDSSVTSCVLASLAAARNAGIEVSAETTTAAIEYLASCQNEDGGFRYQPAAGSSAIARTAAATGALEMVGGSERDVLDKAHRYLAANRAQLSHVSQEAYFPFTAYYLSEAILHGRDADGLRSDLREACLAKCNAAGRWDSELVGAAAATAVACAILVRHR